MHGKRLTANEVMDSVSEWGIRYFFKNWGSASILMYRHISRGCLALLEPSQTDFESIVAMLKVSFVCWTFYAIMTSCCLSCFAGKGARFLWRHDAIYWCRWKTADRVAYLCYNSMLIAKNILLDTTPILGHMSMHVLAHLLGKLLNWKQVAGYLYYFWC